MMFYFYFKEIFVEKRIIAEYTKIFMCHRNNKTVVVYHQLSHTISHHNSSQVTHIRNVSRGIWSYIVVHRIGKIDTILLIVVGLLFASYPAVTVVFLGMKTDICTAFVTMKQRRFQKFATVSRTRVLKFKQRSGINDMRSASVTTKTR